MKIQRQQRDTNFRRMRLSLEAAEKVREIQTSEAYSNFSLTTVQYTASRLCSDEKEKVSPN